ncbi:MAG: class I SAM-dependent methyltransferase [Myxococcales bacterium]|nr:class I SAM-dependent methyltransferase [Myxococcales bacterium]
MESSRCPVHPDAALRPVVRDAADRFWGQPGEFDYGACAVCGTWVLDPRPEPAALGAFYGGYYSDDEVALARRAYGAAPADAAIGVDKLRAQAVIASLGKLGARLGGETRLLDVGCGLGGFARAMRALAGVRAEGLDFDPRCAPLAAELHGLPVATGELRAQRYPDGAFDVVTSWHCLEHTYDPGAELREMARIVAPGGWLVVEVPTPGPLARLFRGRWFFLQAPTHLYHLTKPALGALFAEAGLVVERMERPWVPTELAGSLVMALGLHGFAPRLLFGVRGLAARLWRLLFFALMPLDLLVTGVQTLLGGGGVLRVHARRRADGERGEGER